MSACIQTYTNNVNISWISTKSCYYYFKISIWVLSFSKTNVHFSFDRTFINTLYNYSLFNIWNKTKVCKCACYCAKIWNSNRWSFKNLAMRTMRRVGMEKLALLQTNGITRNVNDENWDMGHRVWKDIHSFIWQRLFIGLHKYALVRRTWNSVHPFIFYIRLYYIGTSLSLMKQFPYNNCGSWARHPFHA